jgi:hypothetical protein
MEVFVMAHAWWHPVGTTPLTEQQRWQGQGSDTAYDGPPDPGLENVYPELLLGGAGTLATRGAMKVAPPLWRLGRKAIKHTDPVTGNRVVRPGIQRTLAGIRNSIVRPGHAGGTRGPITRGVNKGPGTGRWGKPINPPNKTGSPTISRGPTSTPYGPRVGPLGYAIGGAGLGYAANKDEVDNMVSSYFADEPSTQETVEVTAVKPEDKKKKGPDAKNRPEENEINTPNLWETWGSLADNPKERKKAYLSSIKNIYMKKMLLDSIAKLTGGKSQGDAWAQMAIAELDAIEKFDSEERTHNQWKALFFNEDGTYNPPKNRKEAMERGQKLGYTSDQMKDILTVFPKSDSDKKGGVATEQFEIWKAMDEGELKEAYGNIINVNRGSDRGKITAYQAANLLKAHSDGSLELDEGQLTALNNIMNTGLSDAVTTTTPTEASKTLAPQAAIDMLMSNPSPDMQKAFREKYGYLPEGL